MKICRWPTAHEDSGGGNADVNLHLLLRLSHQQVRVGSLGLFFNHIPAGALYGSMHHLC